MPPGEASTGFRAKLETECGSQPSRQDSASNPGERMKLSTDRILTTHVGSLPRELAVLDLLYKKENGDPYDADELDAAVAAAVSEVVHKQVATGIDIVNDGETSKIGYATYIKDRLSGFAGHHPRPPHLDLAPYPEFRDAMVRMMGTQTFKRDVELRRAPRAHRAAARAVREHRRARARDRRNRLRLRLVRRSEPCRPRDRLQEARCARRRCRARFTPALGADAT